MKPLILLFFVCLLHISYGNSEVKLQNVFSAESLKKLYEALESSELRSDSSSVSPSSTAVINDYADNVISQVQSLIVEKGLDTVETPDAQLSFKRKFALITYKGSLKLTEGSVASVSSIKRDGDVVASYSNKYLSIQVPLRYDVLDVNYKYRAQIMKIHQTGRVIGKASSTTLKVDVGLNLTNLVVDLKEFALEDIGNIKLSFKGNKIDDWLLKIITNGLVPSFKGTIKKVVNEKLYDAVVTVVESLNKELHG
ncbi:uncharacterized protein LOC112904817 [Agrilus planipennis]|uniref:Uncharacterized protein LOC112904817 n=1 Tax=Agrilus planipennis TaxID=224129 RepID=A0A7F5R6L0_AGRPL|nr:uncharacterized protein LOC112904817 [Agrilus planipennis]